MVKILMGAADEMLVWEHIPDKSVQMAVTSPLMFWVQLCSIFLLLGREIHTLQGMLWSRLSFQLFFVCHTNFGRRTFLWFSFCASKGCRIAISLVSILPKQLSSSLLGKAAQIGLFSLRPKQWRRNRRVDDGFCVYVFLDSRSRLAFV